MAAIPNELKSNLLSNIVFLRLLIYHNRLKQSSHILSLNHEIPGTMPTSQIKKSDIQKITMKEFQFTFKNSISFLLLDRTPISDFTIIVLIIRYKFGLFYFSVIFKKFIAWLHGLHGAWGHAWVQAEMTQKHLSLMNFPGTTKKIENFHRYRSLKCERWVDVKSGKPNDWDDLDGEIGVDNVV